MILYVTPVFIVFQASVLSGCKEEAIIEFREIKPS